MKLEIYGGTEPQETVVRLSLLAGAFVDSNGRLITKGRD